MLPPGPDDRPTAVQPLTHHSAVVPAPPGGTSSHPEPTAVVRFVLSGDVLPLALDTIRWGDLARRSAMSIYGRRNGGGASLALSGKDEAGRPLQGHMHVFYLPTDEDGDGQLDHLTVWAPAGLSAEEFRAVVSVIEMNPGDGRAPVRLEHETHGTADDFVEGCPVFGRSHLWRSLTPYVPTRHVKRRNTRDKSGRRRVVDGPRDQIRREVSLRWPGGPELVATRQIDPLEPMAPMRPGGSPGFRPLEFSRHRRAGSTGGGAYNFALEFAEPVAGPVSLGFACHYGLGVFVPAVDSDAV